MTKQADQPVFRLHFEGQATQGHVLPAAALVQSVQALQRAIYLLAATHEGKDVKERLRLSHDLERKYSVVVSLPEEGGYVVPYVVGNPDHALFASIDLSVVTDKYLASLDAIQTDDAQALARIIPAGSVRRLYLSALKNMQPPSRMGVHVSIENAQRQKLLVGSELFAHITPMLTEKGVPSVQRVVVTGRLDALDFQARKLTLTLHSGRRIDCAYADGFETALVDNRREWIQVKGEAVLNDDDSLQSLNNVTEVLEVDASPFLIESIVVGGKSLKAKKPVNVDVIFHPEDGFYTATGEFNLIVAAETRDELEASILEAAAFLFNEYVHTDANNLTLDAKQLGQELKSIFGETGDAT